MPNSLNSEKGHETPKSSTEAFANAFEATAEQKPPLDLQKLAGYPEKTTEEKNNTDRYKKIKDELLPKLEAQFKKRDPDRKPQHGDAKGGTIDNKSCFLVIDDNANPRERVFIAKTENAQEGQTIEFEPIPADKITAKAPGYKEIPAIADKIAKAKEEFKKQRGREIEHGEIASIFDDKDYEYILLRDESRQGNKSYRLFKSNQPIPA
jgi:hypothetical protein